MTTQIRLAIAEAMTTRMTDTPISTPKDSDHEGELIIQSPLEETISTQPTPIQLETSPGKRKILTPSDDTPASPNVTLTRTLRTQKSLDSPHKDTRKEGQKQNTIMTLFKR